MPGQGHLHPESGSSSRPQHLNWGNPQIPSSRCPLSGSEGQRQLGQWCLPPLPAETCPNHGTLYAGLPCHSWRLCSPHNAPSTLTLVSLFPLSCLLKAGNRCLPVALLSSYQGYEFHCSHQFFPTDQNHAFQGWEASWLSPNPFSLPASSNPYKSSYPTLCFPLPLSSPSAIWVHPTLSQRWSHLTALFILSWPPWLEKNSKKNTGWSS